jgi:hypothetical protein
MSGQLATLESWAAAKPRRWQSDELVCGQRVAGGFVCRGRFSRS